MKFPSLIRLPKHQRFSYQPRHYDPVKEELDERISRIRQEMGQQDAEEGTRAHSAISGSFRAQSHSKSAPKVGASGIQLIIALFLMVIVFGWLYYGNDIFYLFFGFAPVFVWIRSRHKLATLFSLFAVVGFVGHQILQWQFPFLQEFIILTLIMTAYFWFKAKKLSR